jgi:hypothetical protein
MPPKHRMDGPYAITLGRKERPTHVHQGRPA